jgi:tripartite-type tricarboxylate transporter receptor subunit TctC
MRCRSLHAAIKSCIVFVVCAVAPWQAQAQAQPAGQTIKFVITHPAGGLPDTVARIVGRRLQDRLAQTVVVENRSGANGGIAVSGMLNAPADGLTFVVTDGAILSINPQLYSKLPYNPKDVVPIAALATAPLFLAVHPSMPVTTMKEFITHVKANPGKYNHGSSGVGSIHHISSEALKFGLGLKMAHIPYKGTGEAVPALLGGHVQVLFSAYPSLSGAAGTKRITLLATNGEGRSSQAPDLPAISEFIPGFSYAPIVGIYARAGTSAAVVQRIVKEATAVVKEPEVIKQLAVVGVEPIGGDAAEFRRLLDGEIERVAKVVKAAGIKVE